MFRSTLPFSLIVLWSLTAVAAPTPCNDGQVSSAATDDHCCWPGQGWSDELERCTGAPQCPSGWTAQGSFCVRGEVIRESEKPRAAPAPVAPEKAPAPKLPIEEAKPVIAPKGAEVVEQAPTKTNTRIVTPAAPQTNPPVVSLLYTGGPVPPGATLERRTRDDVLQAGFATFGFGFVGSALVAMRRVTSDDLLGLVSLPEKCQSTPSTAFIPLVGPILISGSYVRNDCLKLSDSYSSRIALNVIGSAVQLTGVALMIAAFVQSEQYVVFSGSGTNGSAWQVTPGTEATPGGITATRSF